MSLKNSYTTSDYVEWNAMLNLVRRLYRDGNIRMSLLISCGCFFGLRISDLLSLKWEQILNSSTLVIIEKKTRKRRVIKINSQLQGHIKDCYDQLNISDNTEPCFLSRKKTIYTIQRINVVFKEIKKKYNLKVDHFSTHSMRKTFGRQIVTMAGGQAEFALIKLSELFNHSDVMTTRRYLGLRTEELLETYDLLNF